MDINTRREGAKGMEQDSFQWCPVTGPGAMSTNWNRRFCLNIRKHTLLGGWPSMGTGCPERLYSLLSWRQSKATWTRFWATVSRWPSLLVQWGWTRWLPDVLSKVNHAVILWFCESLVHFSGVEMSSSVQELMEFSSLSCALRTICSHSCKMCYYVWGMKERE